MDTRKIWKHIQTLMKIRETDSMDALAYMDKEITYEGISCEDYCEFERKTQEYTLWLSQLEELMNDNNDERDEPMEIPPVRPISRYEFIRYPKEHIAFMEITADGGMGTGGQVWLLTDKMEIRSFNFCFGDITDADIFNKLPELKNSILDGSSDKKPRGWQVIYMGMGSFFLYRSKYKDEFKRRSDTFDGDISSVLSYRRDIAYDIVECFMKAEGKK